MYKISSMKCTIQQQNIHNVSSSNSFAIFAFGMFVAKISSIQHNDQQYSTTNTRLGTLDASSAALGKLNLTH